MEPRFVIVFLLLRTFNLCVGSNTPTTAGVGSVDGLLDHHEGDDEKLGAETSQAFVRRLFVKYGDTDYVESDGDDGDDDDNDGKFRMTFEGFEHLLESLGLGEVRIADHGIDEHREPEATGRFRQLHGHNQRNQNNVHHHSAMTSSSSADKRKRRSAASHLKTGTGNDTNEQLQQKMYNTLATVNQISLITTKCLTATELLRTFHIHHHRRHLDYVDHRLDTELGDEREQQNDMMKRTSANGGEDIPDYISQSDFIAICPSIVYQLDAKTCLRDVDGVPVSSKTGGANDVSSQPLPAAVNEVNNLNFSAGYLDSNETNSAVDNDRLMVLGVEVITWAIATLAIAIISLVGLLSVVIISLGGVAGLNSRCYDYLVQFLIALAVGTLTGDALLHLLPHALVPHSEHSDDHGHSDDDHADGDEATMSVTMITRGLVVLAGVYGFLLVERSLMLINKYRRQKSEKNRRLAAQFVRMEAKVGQKLSTHTDNRLSVAVPTVVDDVDVNNDQSDIAGAKKYSVEKYRAASDEDVFELLEPLSGNVGTETTDQRTIQRRIEVRDDPETVDSPSSTMSRRQRLHQLEPTHDNRGHHQHHGHSHDVGGEVQSVAWMVIMGDGLHNFTDGLAIGAAFVAGGLGGGLGTTVAVFCHELPHELGDFAVLMNSGMSIRRALCYNIVSSVLSFIGMVVGLLIGNIGSASSWIFSLTAGIFVYISLVDMVPQMSLPEVNAVTSLSDLSTAGNERVEIRTQTTALSVECAYLVLHSLGIALGVAIMTSIALYEDVIEQFSVKHFND